MTDQPNEEGQPADLPASLAQSNQPVTAAQSGPAPGSVTYVDGDPTDVHVGAGEATSDPLAGAWREQLIEDVLARIPQGRALGANALTSTPQVPSIGRIVTVRAPHRKDAPGIVTDVRSDTVVDVQVFRGDHLPHAYQSLSQMDPANTTGTGWFWPERK